MQCASRRTKETGAPFMAHTADQPAQSAPIPPLYSCTQMAQRIAGRHRTTCAHTTVWAAIRRLGLDPTLQTPGGYKFYTAEQEALIEAECSDVIRRGKNVKPAKL